MKLLTRKLFLEDPTSLLRYLLELGMEKMEYADDTYDNQVFCHVAKTDMVPGSEVEYDEDGDLIGWNMNYQDLHRMIRREINDLCDDIEYNPEEDKKSGKKKKPNRKKKKNKKQTTSL